MKKKKILFLGASAHQVPPIIYAKNQGHYVITADYLPTNPGHKLADEWHKVSTTDLNSVLVLSKKLKIDGIVSYASDVAAPSQAYVAEKMSLVGNPYESVLILTQKDLFRNFLMKHDFLVPNSNSFYNLNEAKCWLDKITLPVIVKPVDSSGSKGVTKIITSEQLDSAFEIALQFSRKKKIIIEEFVIRDGNQIAGDGFVVNSKLVFRCWANEHFDKLVNPLVPIGESFPSIMSKHRQNEAHLETQRLLELLKIKNGALNFDFHYNLKGNFSFIELGPRNGGNLIPEVIREATGVDLIKYTVDSALGFDCSNLKMKSTKGYYSSYLLHAIENGIFKKVFYSDEIRKNILKENIYVKTGEKVCKLSNSNHVLGSMIMKFKTQKEMLDKMNNMEKYLKVFVE
jgi:biotin carboxylase